MGNFFNTIINYQTQRYFKYLNEYDIIPNLLEASTKLEKKILQEKIVRINDVDSFTITLSPITG
jgi:hypothetical protein